MKNSRTEMLHGFINDNREVAILFLLYPGEENDDNIVKFINEMGLQGKFAMYCDIMEQLSGR